MAVMNNARIFGKDSVSGEDIEVKVNADGEIAVNLEAADIEIGAVELKDATTDNRAAISAAGEVSTNVSDRAARDLGKVDIAGIDAVGTIAGQKVMTASVPVVIASDQSNVPVGIADGNNVTQGAKADSAVTDPTAAASVIAALKGLLTLLTTSYLATTASVVIAESASLSAYFDKRGYSKISIEMPAAWTTAGISFAGCSTLGGTYTPVYAEDGIELTISASTSRIVTVGINDGALAAIPYLKIRSGTVETPVVQAAARTLVVLLSR